MQDCGAYSCTKRKRFPRLSGWKALPYPIFGGLEEVWFCPEHLEAGHELSKVVCKHCEKTTYLADGRLGWDYVHTPAGTLWFCPEHIAGQREYIEAQWRR
jgi:hypothetical protein